MRRSLKYNATMTPTKTALRLIIVAEVVLGIGSITAYELSKSAMPEALRSFESNQFEGEISPMLVVTFCFLIVFLIALLTAWIGLFVFWKPARMLYLITMVVSLLLGPFFGPYVETGLSYTLCEATSIVSGIILTLVYFSPLKELYERGKCGDNGSIHIT